MRVVKAATVRPHEGGLRMRGRGMELIALASVAVLALAGVVAWLAPAFGEPDGEATPAFVDKIPPGYRDWKLISVAHEEGNFHSFAAVLGNEVAIQASREGTLPFPDGAIIAALHWRHVPSEENNKVFGRSQSFVAGTPTNVQFMVKDSKKYAATGGWGFGHFNGRDDKPAGKALLQTCFPCHNKIKARDLVFTRYAP
jgi:Cytochrome P460